MSLQRLVKTTILTSGPVGHATALGEGGGQGVLGMVSIEGDNPVVLLAFIRAIT